MRILKAQERSSIAIPLSDLIGEDGQLNLRADLIGRGLVEVKQSKFDLRLQINGLVGRLPLNSRVGLDIGPKFPVSNLNRMVYASNEQLENPFGTERPYEDAVSEDYLPVPLVRTFAAILKSLITRGLLKRYQRQQSDGPPKSRVDFNKTQQKYWSKLKPTMAVVEYYEFGHDNLPNQCLRFAAEKALAISKGNPHLSGCIGDLAASLRQLSRVSQRDAYTLRRDLMAVQQVVPAWRSDYHRGLQQAIKIIGAVDVSLNTAQKGLALESFIISLDDVFEGYVRSVLAELPDFGFGRVATLDGNKKRHQLPFFVDNKKYKIKPDLIVKDGRGALIIGDAKYKKKPSEEDRYQIVSHALAYGVKKAILIYPKSPSSQQSGLVRLGKIGLEAGIEVFEFYYDLSSDMKMSEQQLRSAIQSLA
ncbi:MAG: hypothetical protein ACFB11_22490 [Paracoccaceae bacterium]|mgnify:CR=1 FL=1